MIASTTPALTIVEYAELNHIDLIVTGTHGRGAVAHLLMGSVAERIVRTAPCPVLTVRHPEREFVVPDALVAIARADMYRLASPAWHDPIFSDRVFDGPPPGLAAAGYAAYVGVTWARYEHSVGSEPG